MMMMMSTSTLASTDCSSSSMQGSSTSSASSDVMTLTTTAASSWCAMPASTRLRLVRLVRPHQRRLLVVPPERSASYGFAVRGGKEHGIGFFVSHVEHGGEAQLKGLRIGDQILRINGYRLEDAVHKEFIQLVANQDRVTLKVRGVGMLPVKDQPDERLSWNVVKLPSVSGTPSESSFKTSNERERERDRDRDRERDRERERNCVDRERRNTSRDINVVLHVAPRTKLGLGICKGPEWKPGIFVQFTKERSVAREAGLRPGDQILSVNSIDFSDVLFSEAVAVMKGSTKLDMVVRTAAGCELFPGESSGYNSSASSVTGDQSPCWADAKSKRLTAVREESSQQQQQLQLQLPPVNKTIIKLSENGTSINNTYVQQEQQGEQSISRSTTIRRGNNSNNSVVAPPPPAAPLATDNHNSSSNSNGNVGSSSSSLSSAINEELKKRKEKLQQVQQRNSQQERGASRNVAQMSHKRERNNSVAAAAPPAATSTTTTSGGGGGGDQHTALMDEFKRAHQRMFRNGFHESEHKERGETLKRTSIMPDDSCYRNNNNNNNNMKSNNNNSSSGSNNNSNKSSNASNSGSNRMSLLNGGSNNIVNGSTELPPPPPQFANPQQKQQQQQPQQQQQQQFKLSLANGNNNSNINGSRSKPSTTTTTTSPPLLSPVLRTPSILVGGLRAPATPQPDYDAAGTTTTSQQRRTLRLGTVTIGEYGEQQRGKRETLRKMPSIEASGGQSNGILKNGSNRNSSNYSNNINSNNISNSSSNNFNGRQQQPQSQQTEKSIKFGN